ncbi:hypothetical protein [Streptomyces cyanogenus]|uniref:Secreted protein n=1 Tax=Streptomyces cyanogenus TaxID=80860 RepID=A0ABX7TPY1_STRCY|nr:hypothetical protein [Streptomyces cyanogenus]QTD98651.1 hypothetical protein S1361_14940 [Streptomyces cyanogenus]
MCEQIGETMQKLKKVAAVAVMVGGMGLIGGGVASAHGYDGEYPIGNLQPVECEQSFDAGAAFANLPVAGGDNNQNIGNFCTVIGSIDD